MSFVTNLAGTLKYNSFVDGSPSGVDNDQGNIRAGGTIDESNKFTSSALGEETRFVILSSGAGGTTGVIAPSTVTTFNQYSQLDDILKVTTTLAGVSNNAILFGSSDSANGPAINQLAVARTLQYKTAIVAGNWNSFSGAFSPALTSTVGGGWSIVDSAEQGGTLIADKTDKAANPSAAEPGQLAYMVGNPIPTTGFYARKTNW